jgi:SagB-type dehydrogenase family enzyme
MTKKYLPQPVFQSKTSVEECLLKRRSVRNFKYRKLSLQEISQLLWSAYGVTDQENMFKTTPSAGATYPLEIFYLIEDGIYHYLPEEHAVKCIKQGDFRKELVSSVLGQDFIFDASINIIICAVYERTTLYYGNRGVRYVHFEVGHCAQNLCLQAISLGLDSVCIGAFDDKKLKNLLSISVDIEPLYIVSIGVKK